jgi:hypothetical protein
MIFLSSRAADVACMTKKGNSTHDDVVKAFRKAANELGCCQSERRFQEALFVIGRHKPPKARGKRRSSGNINMPRLDR